MEQFIENRFTIARFDPVSGTLSLVDRRSSIEFVKDARLPGVFSEAVHKAGGNGAAPPAPEHGTFAPAAAPAAPAARATFVECRTGEVNDPAFGPCRQLVLERAGSGERAEILLPAEIPFCLVRCRIANNTAQTRTIVSVPAFRAVAGLGPERLKAFGTAGLKEPDDHAGSYAFLALVEPLSRSGVVAGWLTHDRGTGIFTTRRSGRPPGGGVQLDAHIDYGNLRLAPGESAGLETMAIGYFDDAREGLELYADCIAKVYRIKLPRQVTGYCSWYADIHGRASDEKHVAKLAEYAAKHLLPFGFDVVQIDDGWQNGKKRNGPAKDFSTHAPDGPYPSGMRAIADVIRSHGLQPGIWLMPFSGDHEEPVFAGKEDWFVRRTTGEVYETAWAGTSLDMTHPGAREYVREVVSRMTREWGYSYLKLDAMLSGLGVEIVYVNEEYCDDALGDAVFHDPSKTNVEAYRDGLKLVRDAAGEGVFVLGCCPPQNMRVLGASFGLVDSMRINPDNNAGWPEITRGPRFGSRFYFLNGRVWYNDPDPVYVRGTIPLSRARLIASWVAIAGQMTISSDWLPALPGHRLDILKRIIPNHGLPSRPADLFEQDIPRIWLLTDPGDLSGGAGPKSGLHPGGSVDESDRGRSGGRGGPCRPAGPGAPGARPRRDVIGLFNWESERTEIDYDLERIGLAADKSYIAFDFWENALVPGVMRGRLRVPVPAQSCRVLSVRPVADHPQVISTSRHVTQGLIDVMSEEWREESLQLAGRSRVVAGDPYELRIVWPEAIGLEIESVAVSAGDSGSGTAPASPVDAGGETVSPLSSADAGSETVSPASTGGTAGGATISIVGMDAPFAPATPPLPEGRGGPTGHVLRRVRIDCPVSREVSWTIRFRRGGAGAAGRPA